MSNLVPQQRITKNGHVVIRHMRPESADEKTRSAIPAPVVASTAAQAHKPTKMQLKVRRMEFDRRTYNVSFDLRHALDSDEPNEISFEASDAEMYSVMSILPVGESLAMLERGYRTVDDVQEFLREHGIEFLGDDPDDTALKAFSRGIPADTYCDIKMRYGGRTTQEILLDVAEAAGMKPLEKHAFYIDVLREQSNLADIKEVGATRISKCRTPNVIREVLRDIKSGERALSPNDLKRILDRTNGGTCSLTAALSIADICGTDFTLELDDIAAAEKFWRYDGDSFQDTESFKSALSYVDAMGAAWMAETGSERFGLVRHSDFSEMQQAGIDPVVAGRMFGRGLTPTQIIASVKHDIPISVAEGWL